MSREKSTDTMLRTTTVEPVVVEVGHCPIRNVRVYEDKAEVRRAVVRVKLEKGYNELLFIQFPTGAEPTSVHVESRKAAGLFVKNICVESVQLGKMKTATAARSLHKEAKRLRKERAAKEVALSNIRDERKALLTMSSAPLTSPDAFNALAVSLKDHLQKLLHREMEVKTALTKLERLLAKFEEEASERQGLGIAARVGIEVKESSGGAEAELELVYAVSGASWLPTYDVILDTKGRKMRLSYWASIKQQSGEKWLDAKVTVVSGTFAMGGQVPKQRMQEVVKRMSPDEESKPRPDRAVVVAYDLDGRRTIHSSPQPQDHLVTEVELEPQLEYFCIPKDCLAAYIRVRTILRSAYTLLPGHISLYRDGYLVSQSFMGKLVLPKEEFVFPLGPERYARIEYAFREDRNDSIKDKKTRLVLESRINVKNKGKEKLKLTLLEQVPKSFDPGAVKVSVAKPDFNNKTRINRFNYIEWQLELGPDEDKTVDSKIIVEVPMGEEPIFR